MSVSHRHSRGFNGGGESLSYDKTFTSGAEVNVSEAVADGVTDLLVEVEIDVSRLKSLFISADQDLTLETNQAGGASGAPDDTLALKADLPIIWTEDDPHACPLTADVTGVYVTNASGAATTLEIRALLDPTP